MNKISSFHVTELTVEGFKNFAERQIFKFGSMNTITGHNGQGKSSIAEAIAYAITGAPFFGTEKTLDRLYTIGGKEATVELTIVDGDGCIHKLIRSRNTDKTSLTYDGVSIRQNDLTLMFGERDVFLSIFNPLYFIEVLGNEGRNLLERLLPPVSHEVIMGNLSDPIHELLKDEQMSAPEARLDKIRTEIRELESTVIYVEGQRDLLDTQTKTGAQTLKQKQDDLSTLNQSIAALEVKRTQGLDFDTMKIRLNELYQQYDSLSKSVPTLPITGEVDAEILAVSTKLEQRQSEEFVSKYAQPIAEARATVERLKAQYFKDDAILKELVPGIQCPMCKQSITEQNIEAVKKAFGDSVADILDKGRSKTAELSELTAMETKSKEIFEQFKADDLEKLRAALAQLQAKREQIVGEAGKGLESRSSYLDELKAQIQTLEMDIENGNLTPDETQELIRLRQSQTALTTEIAAYSDVQLISGAKFKAESDIEDLKESIKNKRGLESAIKAYIAERVRLLFSDFTMLQRVKIVLYDVIKKTGEIKDVFKFSYEDRPYNCLSLSEKIRAGLEISELMKRLAGCNYPVFIDNGESVPVIDNIRPSGQIFVSQVVKGAPLTVDILDSDATAGVQSAA